MNYSDHSITSVESNRATHLPPELLNELYSPNFSELPKAWGARHIATTASAAAAQYLTSFGAIAAIRYFTKGHAGLTVLSGVLHKMGDVAYQRTRAGVIAPPQTPFPETWSEWLKIRGKELVTEDLPFFWFSALYALQDCAMKVWTDKGLDDKGAENNWWLLGRLGAGCVASAATALTVQAIRHARGGEYTRIEGNHSLQPVGAIESAANSPFNVADALGRAASLIPVGMTNVGKFQLAKMNPVTRAIVPPVVLIGGWIWRRDIRDFIEPFALAISECAEAVGYCARAFVRR